MGGGHEKRQRVGIEMGMSSHMGPCGSVMDVGFTPDEVLAEVTAKGWASAWQSPLRSTVRLRAEQGT